MPARTQPPSFNGYFPGEPWSDSFHLFFYLCFFGKRNIRDKWYHRHIKYSLDFLRPIRTSEAFEAVDWLAYLPQRTWPQAMAASRPVEWRHFVEVNSRNLGGGHVCWGSYDGFNSAGWHSGCEWHQCCPSCCATKRLKLLKLPQKYGENHSLHHMFSSSTARHLREETLFTFFSSLMPVPHKLTVFVEV